MLRALWKALTFQNNDVKTVLNKQETEQFLKEFNELKRKYNKQ
jgi:hypothetical protein